MDTVSSGKDLTWFFSQGWSSLVVALVIYGGGLTAQQIVTAIWPQTRDLTDGKVKVMDPKLPFLFRLWYTTRLSHPFIVGAAISFIPGLPAPEFVTSHTSGALWFGFCGIGNGQIHMLAEAAYRQVMKVVNSLAPWIRQRLGMPASQSTPPPAHDPTPSTDATPISEDKKPSDPPPPEAA